MKILLKATRISRMEILIQPYIRYLRINKAISLQVANGALYGVSDTLETIVRRIEDSVRNTLDEDQVKIE